MEYIEAEHLLEEDSPECVLQRPFHHSSYIFRRRRKMNKTSLPSVYMPDGSCNSMRSCRRRTALRITRESGRKNRSADQS